MSGLIIFSVVVCAAIIVLYKDAVICGLYNKGSRKLGFQLTIEGKPIETTSSGGVARDINDIQNDSRVKKEQHNATIIIRFQRNIEKQKR